MGERGGARFFRPFLSFWGLVRGIDEANTMVLWVFGRTGGQTRDLGLGPPSALLYREFGGWANHSWWPSGLARHVGDKDHHPDGAVRAKTALFIGRPGVIDGKLLLRFRRGGSIG